MFQINYVAVSINICSIEIKWDGKNKIWDDNEMRWIRITVWNGGDLQCLKKLKKLMNT